MLTWNSGDKKITPLEHAEAADVLDLSWNPGDMHAFIKITPSLIKPVALYMAKYPVTNAQYERFLQPEYFANPSLWTEFPQFYRQDHTGRKVNPLDQPIDEGWQWLQKELHDIDNLLENGVLFPSFWRDGRFGVARPSAPVVGITWWEANAYCKWLLMYWDVLEEGKHGLPKPKQLRLPTESEWTLVAGGEYPENRYAWDAGPATTDLNEILQRANIVESNINRTTPVWMYPLGATPDDVMDMTGNIREWQANCVDQHFEQLFMGRHFGTRGGSWNLNQDLAGVAVNFFNFPPGYRFNYVGFRVVALPE